MTQKIEYIHCPYCNFDDSELWASENGFEAVKCNQCGFIYVNPRPVGTVIKHAVETGYHAEIADNKSVVARRVPGKVPHYRRLFKNMFADVWDAQKPIAWLDIGAGYGEIVEAVEALAPAGSVVDGVEPMQPKAAAAKARGLTVYQGYVSDLTRKYEFVSLVHVFSHIADFRSFLNDVKLVLEENGDFFLETGNAADLKDRSEVPTELDLPDHLTFAGQKHIVGFLEDAGFQIVMIQELRRDNLLNFCKNTVKKLMGRNVYLRLPYTSEHRAIRVRAKLARHP